MKKTKIVFVVLVCILINYVGALRAQENKNVKIKRYKYFSIYSDNYNVDFKLWYNIKIIKAKDTLRIRNLSSENGSEFFIKISPDNRFFIIDNIIKGSTPNEAGEEVIHENYTCAIVDVRKAKVIYTMQSDCSGYWNNKGQWLSGSKIVFDTHKYK